MITLQDVYKLQNALRASVVCASCEITVLSEGDGFMLSLGQESTMKYERVGGGMALSLITPKHNGTRKFGSFDRVGMFLYIMQHRAHIV